MNSTKLLNVLDQTTDAICAMVPQMIAQGISPDVIKSQVRFNVGLAMHETRSACLDSVQVASSAIQRLDWEPARVWRAKNKPLVELPELPQPAN